MTESNLLIVLLSILILAAVIVFWRDTRDIKRRHVNEERAAKAAAEYTQWKKDHGLR